MIYFIGAGPGAVDLITVRGMRLLQRASLVIYAGSLVNPELLDMCPADCVKMNSASMTLEQVIAALRAADPEQVTVRLHTGDPSIYGAVREQMEALDALGLSYEAVPGVSSMNAAAACLHAEYTLPGVSQTLIVSRRARRTAVPEQESIPALAAHGASMALFLSAGMLPELCSELIAGGYAPDTPAALVYKATWPDEQIIRATLLTLPQMAAGIGRTALVLVGGFLNGAKERSRLYDPSFSHMFREAEK
ncbi:MAG: precorrin-4 C(11)-methyltransferase [Clostridia bacterium]|nr:precorrin-4 C(11)-methyltransferase [Clostridia bacterium]